MRRLAAILVAGLLLGGCFALDEIDQGQEILRQHSAPSDDADSAEPEGESTPGLLDRARTWIGNLGDDAGASASDGGPPPHPDNVLVRCDIQGRLEFTRKFTCHRKGGKVLGPMHSSRR